MGIRGVGDILPEHIGSGFGSRNVRIFQQKHSGQSVNVLKSVKAGFVGAATSYIGSYAGEKLFKGVENVGNTLIEKGHTQATKGITRALSGKSHTSYFQSAAKALTKGRAIVNLYRGLSSSLGSVIRIVPGLASNLIKPYSRKLLE